MKFERLSAPTLKSLFVSQLQDKILSGEIPIGTALPSERELAAQMKVSRAVVNSGLAELAEEAFWKSSRAGGRSSLIIEETGTSAR